MMADVKDKLTGTINKNVDKAYDNEKKKEQLMQRIRELRTQQMQEQQTGDDTKEKMLDNDISQAERQKQDVEQEQQKNKLNISGVGTSNNVYQPTNAYTSRDEEEHRGLQ